LLPPEHDDHVLHDVAHDEERSPVDPERRGLEVEGPLDPQQAQPEPGGHEETTDERLEADELLPRPPRRPGLDHELDPEVPDEPDPEERGPRVRDALPELDAHDGGDGREPPCPGPGTHDETQNRLTPHGGARASVLSKHG